MYIWNYLRKDLGLPQFGCDREIERGREKERDREREQRERKEDKESKGMDSIFHDLADLCMQ